MSRLRRTTMLVAALALIATSAVAITTLATATAARAATAAPTADHSKLVGELGYEGGPAPGGFHPGPGTVEVNWDGPEPISLLKKVGKSGHFTIKLGPGKYTVIGCGPNSSVSGMNSQCSKPKTFTLTTGEVHHVRLVWAYTP